MATIIRLTTLLATACLALLVSSTSVSAQTSDLLEIVSQDTSTDNNGEWSIQLAIDDSVENFEVDITIFGASKAPFETSTEPIHRINNALLTSNDTEPDALNWSSEIRGFGSEANADALLIPTAGSYPVEFDLRIETDVVATITTMMLVTDSSSTSEVSLVLSPDISQLENTIDLIADTQQPVHLAIDNFALSELASNPTLLDKTEAALSNSFVIPYNNSQVALDAVDDQTANIYFEQLNRQKQWLSTTQLSSMESTALYTQQLGQTSSFKLEQAGYSKILGKSESIFKLNSLSNNGFAASLPDNSFEQLNIEDPIAQAMYLLSTFETTSNNPSIGVIAIENDENLNAATQILGIDDLDFVRLDQLTTEQGEPFSEDGERLVESASATQLEAAQFVASHFSLGNGVASDSLQYGGELMQLIGEDSSELNFQTLANAIELDLTQTSVVSGQALNLASTDAVIPITIVNSSNSSRTLRLEIDSDKATIDEPSRDLTVQPGTNQIDVQLQLRSLGNSSLDIMLLTPDGLVVLSEDSLTIRSTAFPGMGLLLSLGALGSLLVWWALTARKKRNQPPEESIDLTMPAKSSHAL